jgi:hypothetical protein
MTKKSLFVHHIEIINVQILFRKCFSNKIRELKEVNLLPLKIFMIQFKKNQMSLSLKEGNKSSRNINKELLGKDPRGREMKRLSKMSILLSITFEKF